jgi:hypothetical protein
MGITLKTMGKQTDGMVVGRDRAHGGGGGV